MNCRSQRFFLKLGIANGLSSQDRKRLSTAASSVITNDVREDLWCAIQFGVTIRSKADVVLIHESDNQHKGVPVLAATADILGPAGMWKGITTANHC